MITLLSGTLLQKYDMPYTPVRGDEFELLFDMFVNDKTRPLPDNPSGALCNYYGLYYSQEDYYLKAMMRGYPSAEEGLRKLIETKDDAFSVLLYRLLTCKPVERGMHIWEYISQMIIADNALGIMKLFTITKEPFIPHTRQACDDLTIKLIGELETCSRTVYGPLSRVISTVEAHMQVDGIADLIESYAGTYARMKYSIPKIPSDQTLAIRMFKYDEIPQGNLSADLATLVQIYCSGMGDYTLAVKHALTAITKGSIKAAWNMYVLSSGTPEERFYWMVFNMMADRSSIYFFTYMTEAVITADPDMFLMPERLLPDMFTKELAGHTILCLSDQLKVFDQYDKPIRMEVIRLIQKHLDGAQEQPDYARQVGIVEYMTGCVTSSNPHGLMKILEMKDEDVVITDETLLECCMEVFLWLERQPKIDDFDTLEFASKIGL